MLRPLLTAVLLLVGGSPVTADVSPQDLLPPAPPWTGASEALIVAANHPWITPAETTGLTDTPNYDDTIAWLRKLAEASPFISLQAFGRTPQGRPLYAVMATRDGVDDVRRLPATGRPTLLAQAGIHSGEIDGKDAGLMLLRDLAFGGKSALLDKANFLLVPVFNADGHERSSEWNRPNQRGPVHQGWRTTAQNLNLNRDYMKAAAPEMRAMLQLIRLAQPSLYLDLHVTDGIDYQYDITYGFHGWGGKFAWSPRSGQWLDEVWRPAMDSALQSAGHIPGRLIFAVNDRDLTQGIGEGPADPRFSSAYGDLRHLPTVLVENHSLKPYRQRVLGTYVLLEASLRTLGDHAAALQAALATDRAARPATLALNWGGQPDSQSTMDFLGIAYEEYVSPASGTTEVRWLGTPKTYRNLPVRVLTKPGIELRRPKAYYVPITERDVLATLEAHGIQMETLPAPVTRTLEQYRLVNPKVGAMPFEGRHLITTQVAAEAVTVTLPAATVRVSTDQPLGDLAIALLEPESKDSLFAWGFMPEILQRTEYVEGYVLAPLAERMLAENPALKSAFEAKLAAEPEFAGNPNARLSWFYSRSKFADTHYLLYPVRMER
ncbi:MAG: M14 family metallopeptidase [Candidatus Didemnitutus sp.]|nr:M14 family metallopeptidase [Candidatus Didemnitutus sp.]